MLSGELSDPAWASAKPLREFTQREPDEGAPASELTEVRILYDEHAIYFGFRCHDKNPAAIAKYLTRRDDESASDFVEVDLDTRGDHSSAVHFEVSASGVQRDALRTGDDALDYNWDAVWGSAVKVDAGGWTAELAIPLTALRYEREDTQHWFVQFKRFIARRNELDLWRFMPKLERGEMLRYGPLQGLEDLPQPSGFHLRPFVLGRFRNRTAPPELGLPTGNDVSGSAGIDLRYGLTSGLSLDATILPDFGQVEADPAILNLTTFEFLYPEKRPFFLEGSELFTLINTYGGAQPAQLFYSRRIGAAAPTPYVPEGANLLSTPERELIVGATKLTGRIAERLSIALLDAVTAPSLATLSDAESGQFTERLAPLSNYFVARLRAPLVAGITAGAVFTDVTRAERPGTLGLHGLCPDGTPQGPDGRCTHDAATAAVDLSWQTEDGAWVTTATLMGSRIIGGPPRALPDGTTLAAGDQDLGWRVQIAKPGGNVYTEVLYEGYGPKLDLNDTGYLRQQNLQRVYGQLGLHGYNMGPAREAAVGVLASAGNSFDGVKLLREAGLDLVYKGRNFWDADLTCWYRTRTFDNRETRDGDITERPPIFYCNLWTASNPASAITGSLTAVASTTWKGGSIDALAPITFRPLDRLDLTVAPGGSALYGDPRWVDTLSSGEYLFGLQRAYSAGVTLRSTLTFNPKLTLQAYAQLFFASVSYDTLYTASAAEGGRTLFLSDLVPSTSDPAKYDGRNAVLNVNLVLRWEYLPGSELYLVYTRGHLGDLAALDRDPSGNFIRPPLLNFGALANAPVENIFLAKLSYYFAR